MEVSVEKQFNENKSHTFLYLGYVLFSVFLLTFFGYLNFVQASNPPSIITYQGKLLNGSVAVTTTQAIKYVLYDAVSGGNALYSAAGSTSSPSTVSTTVNDGFFTIDLGDTGTNTIDPVIFKNNETVYLQVTVGGEILVPRKRITASPYALNAKYLDGIGASTTPQSASYIPISDSSGNFNLNNVTSTGMIVTGGLVVTGESEFATTTVTILNSIDVNGTNLNFINGQVLNLNSSGTANLTDMNVVNATTTGSFWSNLLTATTGWFTNLFWTDATSTGNTHLNTLVATGNTTLATTTISSSTIGALNVSNDTNIGGLLSVTGNSAFGNITSGTWDGTIISNAKGGTGQDSSGWTGFVKATAGVWATSTISSNDLSNSTTIAYLANNQTFTGLNIFTATTTFTTSTFSGRVGIGTTAPSEKFHLYDGTLLVDSPVNPTLLGSYDTTGTVYAVDISGKYAYVADDASGLEIFEISNPMSPALIGYYDTAGDARDVKIVGKYAYVADNADGLLIFDISDPSNPTLVGSYDTPNNAVGVYISGKYAYVSDIASLVIVDISNPKNPTLAARLSTVAPIKTIVSGEYAYLARAAGGGLSIVNISNPLNPVIVSSTSYISNSFDVDVSGRYAYLANGANNNVVAYDISSPAAPVQTFSITTVGPARGVYVSGKYAYITDTSTFYIFDTSAAGALVGSYAINEGNSLKIVGKYAYVANGTSGFNIIDIKGADISSANIGNIATNDLTVWENVDIGNNLSIRNGLNIGNGGILSNGAVAITVSTTISTTTLFSVGTSTPSILSVMGNGNVGIGTSTPAEKLHINGGNILHTAFGNPTLKGSLSFPLTYSVYVSGKFAYMADYSEGLKIVDISEPASPTLTGAYSSLNASGIYVSGNYAYLASGSDGLRIIDISNSASPTLSGIVGTTNAQGVYVSGKYAYVADSTSGLQVIDVSNPKLPIRIGNASTTNAIGVYVSGKYAYVADLTSGLRIIDISSPSSPLLVGTASTTIAYSVYVSGKYAYVADGASGLRIINISVPSSPLLVGTVGTTNAQGVYVSGKYAYVADGTSGLKVLNISSSATPTLVGAVGTTNAFGVYVSGKYAYAADLSGGLRIIDINGLDIPTMNVGNIATNDLTVSENIDVGNTVSIRNGLNLGVGGLYSSGAMVITVSTTISTSTLFSVGTSTPFFIVDADGSVKIGTTTTVGLGNSYKLFIDAGATSSGAIGVNGFIRASSYITGTTTLDLAETYPINSLCASSGTCPIDGDVVCSDPTIVAGVKKCSISESNSIIGIVSANPGFLLGGGENYNSNQINGTVKVALAGRVPLRVSLINGVINSGDKLTLSDVDGVAAKAVGEVPTVGVAMENYSGGEDDMILVFVSLGWQNQIYQALTVDSSSSTITVGSNITPYNLALSGEFTMFNNVLNKLVFNATAVFESKTNDTHAFIFNALNFGTSTDRFLLSLRSNSEPRFSVMTNGDVRASGNIYAASAVFGTSSNPGDLAERVDIAADDMVEPGDVLVVDMNNPDTYRRSSGANQQSVAGVVSTNPTIVVGNGKTEFTSVMAMVGRVPLKVSDENGVINRGDLLVTASTTGYAMKYDSKKDNDDKMVAVVGVALDPFVGGKGKIMALVRTGWVNSRYESISSIKGNIQQLATAQGIVFGATSTANLNIEKNNSGQLVYSGGDLNLQGSMLLNVASIIGKNNSWTIDESGHFITRLNTSQGEKEMYAIQSPTSEFVFSSSSQLMSGEAKIFFDQTMQDIIDTQQPLKINITLTSGEAKGIYVSEKNSQGFTVKELGDGTSAATFDWMVVAKRKEEVTGLNVVNISVPTGDIQVVNTQTTTVVDGILTNSAPVEVPPSKPATSDSVEITVPSVVPPITPEVIILTPALTPVSVPAPEPASTPIITAPVVNTVETTAPPSEPAPTQIPASTP